MTKEKPRCPNLIIQVRGDEMSYWCDLSDHPCSLEYNDEKCEEYEDYLKEQEED